MSESDSDNIVAYDYTAIVTHRGKLFTVGDLSLSRFGGIDLNASWVALIPAIIAGPAIAVVLALVGVTAWWATIPAILVWAGVYAWCSRETVDVLAPHNKILLTVSSWRTQPVQISGTTSARTRNSNALMQQLGTRHPGEDRAATELRWVVIVKRPRDSDRLDVGAAVRGRQQYQPRPRTTQPVIADDRDQFSDWYAYLEQQGSSYGSGPTTRP